MYVPLYECKVRVCYVISLINLRSCLNVSVVQRVLVGRKWIVIWSGCGNAAMVYCKCLLQNEVLRKTMKNLRIVNARPRFEPRIYCKVYYVEVLSTATVWQTNRNIKSILFVWGSASPTADFDSLMFHFCVSSL